MKHFLLFAVLLIASCTGGAKRPAAQTEATGAAPPAADALQGDIQLSGAFALYPMAVRWSEEFKKLHPSVRIDVSGGGAGKGMTDVLAGVIDLGMVSREIYPEETSKGAFPIAVVKDAVIPTINARNPALADIQAIGLKRETAAALWNKEFDTWGQALGIDAKTPVHVYTRSDACGAAETFAAWLGKKQEQLKATAVYGDPGVASAVQNDRVAIGFNNIAYTYDQKTKRPFENMAVMPIDCNGNGKIDPEENFYETTETLIAAIADGRFPSPPARDLYLVSKGKPQKPAVIAFLTFILSEGQSFAAETGYIGLPPEKLASERAKFSR